SHIYSLSLHDALPISDVFVNCTPIPSLFKTQPDRYEFHLTNFAENWANLEAIYRLLSHRGHADFRIVVTVSPVPLMNTFSTMDRSEEHTSELQSRSDL